MPAHYTAVRVRHGAAVFIAGKLCTALLTVIALAMVARRLSLSEYGLYIAAVAMMELGLALSTFGMDWVAARAIPEIREKGSGRMLERFIWRLGAIQSAAICGLALVLAALGDLLAGAIALPQAGPVLRIFGFVMAVEGVGRLVRDQMLGTLLLQRQTQVAQFVRMSVFVVLVWTLDSGASALTVAWMELAAAATGLVFGAVLLFRSLYADRGRPAADTKWCIPPRWQFFRLACNAYGSYVFSLAYSAHVITLIVARLLGAEEAALFGFARQIVDLVRRYLPADLFMSLVRPAMVAGYTSGGGAETLHRQSRLLLMGSLLLLAPIVVFVAAFGGSVLAFLGGEAFRAGGGVLAAFLLVLVPFSLRRILELVANITHRSDVCLRAAATLLFVPVAVCALLVSGAGLAGAVAAMITGEVIFVVLVLRGLAQSGPSFPLPVISLSRLALAVVLCWGILILAPIPSDWPPAAVLVVGGALSCVSFAAAVLLLRTVEAPERAAISQLLGQRSVPS